MVESNFIFSSVVIKHNNNLLLNVFSKQGFFKEIAQHYKTKAEGSLMPPTMHCRESMSGCENWPTCCLSGQTLPSFVPSIMLTLLSGTKKGDSSNTCCTWGGKGRERGQQGWEREHKGAKETSREMALMLSTVIVAHPEVPSAWRD